MVVKWGIFWNNIPLHCCTLGMMTQLPLRLSHCCMNTLCPKGVQRDAVGKGEFRITKHVILVSLPFDAMVMCIIASYYMYNNFSSISRNPLLSQVTAILILWIRPWCWCFCPLLA